MALFVRLQLRQSRQFAATEQNRIQCWHITRPSVRISMHMRRWVVTCMSA